MRPILVATAVSGTLDILFAVMLSLMRARDPAAMLRFVASGPFPEATDWGAAGSLLGLAVHFILMAIMVASFVLVTRERRLSLDSPPGEGTRLHVEIPCRPGVEITGQQ